MCSNGRLSALQEIARRLSAVRQERQSRRRYHEHSFSRQFSSSRRRSARFFIFFGTLFFMLLGRTQLRRVLVAFFDERDARLRTLKIMNDIEHNLTGYLSIVALINIGVGLCGGCRRLGQPDCRIPLPGRSSPSY